MRMNDRVDKSRLGEKQRRYVNSLRENADHQTTMCLFSVNYESKECFYCALGVAYLSEGRVKYLKSGKKYGLDDSMVSALRFRSKQGLIDIDSLPECGIEELERLCRKTYAFDDFHTFATQQMQLAIIHLNDRLRMTFDQIADFIEKYPQSVFKEPV